MEGRRCTTRHRAQTHPESDAAMAGVITKTSPGSGKTTVKQVKHSALGRIIKRIPSSGKFST
eukprot:2197053-Rhodomonas_salina.2